MSWGVATQNGVSVSLASIVSLSCGATEFSPASLFTSGVAGAWYDPSDYSTLFQDSAGTTPVTAVEQPVGLMLDKSQGLVPTVIYTNDGTTASGWTYSGGAGGSIVSSSGKLVFTAATTLTALLDRLCFYTLTGLTSGATYKVTAKLQNISDSVGARLSVTSSSAAGDTTGSFVDNLSASLTDVQLVFVASATTMYLRLIARAGNSNAQIGADDISVALLPGNHARQATPTSCPVLRARYNSLLYSETFSNAVWQSASSGTAAAGVKTPNFGTAPDGTQTACRIQLDVSAGSTGNQSQVYQNYACAVGNLTYQCYVKTNDGSTKTICPFTATGAVLTVTGTWQLFTFTRSSGATTDNFQFILIKGTTSDTADLLVWHPQSNPGSSAGTYQRIAAATDYATAGFLPYLYFDGSDDYLTIANTDDLNFGQGSFWAQTGLTSLGASQYDVVWGKNSASNDNIRLFLISTDNLGVFWGTDAQSYAGSTFQITKNTAQIQEWGINSSGPTAFYALNGTENTPAITLSGTGSNSSPAYIGINNNLTQYQTQMNLYGMILRKGTLPTATERTASRNWMAAKSGVVL